MNARTVIADAREVVTAATAAAAVLIADGLLAGTAERWTTGILAAASAVGVAVARRTRKPKPVKGSENPTGNP